MKRAWPYAVALAVVVTGCYLALTPLLRSLSPGATTSSSSLSNIKTTATVEQFKGFTVVSDQNGKVAPVFVTGLHAKKKAKKKATTTTTTTTPPTDTTGFARGSSGTQAPTKTPTTTKTKTKPAKKGSGTVSGSVDQSSTGGGGLAGSGNGDGTVGGGTQSDPAAN